MTTDIILHSEPSALAVAGHVANDHAARQVFNEYRARLAPSTRRRQDAGLALFAEYLGAVGLSIDANELTSNATAWHGVTWGLVTGFCRWMLGKGYAIGTVNVRLATIKSYCKLAAQARAIAPDTLALIQTVKGYSTKEGRNLNEQRAVTRLGHKAAAPVPITTEQARTLKAQRTDVPQSRRDGLLMALLLDHGLRVGEVEGLSVGAIDLKAGTLTFYRSKVDKVQTHRLTADSQRAAMLYLQQDTPPADGPLMMGSEQSGALVGTMGARAMRERVRVLGKAEGLKALSPHDCRHYWATVAMRNGTDVKALQEAGGWASPAMPLRYAEAARIANEGVKLG